MRTIYQRLKEIIVKELGVEESTVPSDTSFCDLGANPFDVIELILAFEQEFGIEIRDADAERVRTFRDAFQCIYLGLILGFEQELGIEINFADAVRLRNFAEYVAFLHGQGGAVDTHGILHGLNVYFGCQEQS